MSTARPSNGRSWAETPAAAMQRRDVRPWIAQRFMAPPSRAILLQGGWGWIALVGQIARNDGLSLAAAAEAYARVGIAVTDAFIQCWNTKYADNLQRPVTFIQDNLAAGWLPYLVTPNFPTYTSGHSTQSGAAATVLTDMLGIVTFTDTIRTDHNLVPPLAPRTFISFDDAAAEAALSRLYAGIHYSFDNNDGLASGQCIGQTIIQNVHFKDQDDDDDAEDKL